MNNMVISSNEQATRIHGMYNRNVGQMNAAMTRIATAQKINSAKDNASVWAISQKMRERMRANDQANQNVQNDSALLKTAQGGLDNTLSILNTLKERAVNAANDSNITGDREKIAEEVRQLVTQIDENANRVKFNGRILLNGAGETADTTSVTAAGKDAPNAVTATGNYGDKAVYSLTGLKTFDGSDLTSDTKLTNLTDADGNRLFEKGDRISFSWTENGQAKESTLLVDNTTVMSAMSATGLTFAGAMTQAKLATDELNAKDETGTKLTAGTPGFYFEGAANTNVSNVAIGVKDASGNVKKETQAALELNPVQQSYGDPYKASNLVYHVDMTNLSTSYVTTLSGNSRIDTIAIDNNTEFYRLGSTYSTNLGTDGKDWAGAIYTLSINDKTVTFTGNMSINQINDMLEKNNIDVRMYYAEAGAKLYYGEDGDEITKGTYGASALYTTAQEGLKIVAGSDMDITTFKLKSNLSASALGTNVNFDISKGTDALIKAELLRDDTADTSAASKTDTSASMLPRGQELQFFVGGEQNFGVNFAIGKATSQNLLGMSVEDFAAKFGDKDGANEAIGIIDNAISKTLVEQTRLGAMEARLGYTSDNLITMNENLESGVAAYTGSDMAKEMTEYMKYSVVSQAAQYMLANASQNAYNVLQLLQP